MSDCLYIPTKGHPLEYFVSKVVAKVVGWVACVVHSRILDRIQTLICTDVFEFIVQEKKNGTKKMNSKKKRHLTTIVCLPIGMSDLMGPPILSADIYLKM